MTNGFIVTDSLHRSPVGLSPMPITSPALCINRNMADSPLHESWQYNRRCSELLHGQYASVSQVQCRETTDGRSFYSCTYIGNPSVSTVSAHSHALEIPNHRCWNPALLRLPTWIVACPLCRPLNRLCFLYFCVNCFCELRSGRCDGETLTKPGSNCKLNGSCCSLFGWLIDFFWFVCFLFFFLIITGQQFHLKWWRQNGTWQTVFTLTVFHARRQHIVVANVTASADEEPLVLGPNNEIKISNQSVTFPTFLKSILMLYKMATGDI